MKTVIPYAYGKLNITIFWLYLSVIDKPRPHLSFPTDIPKFSLFSFRALAIHSCSRDSAKSFHFSVVRVKSAQCTARLLERALKHLLVVSTH